MDHYPPIADYGLLSDCHSIALVSRSGSVDWCCMERIDNDSTFGRLLDWRKGGFWSLAPADGEFTSTRHYVPGTLVLTTEFQCSGGTARAHDLFAVFDPDDRQSPALLVRIVEGISGEVDMAYDCTPRFDYGALVPRILQRNEQHYTAWGSNQGLLLYSDVPLQIGRGVLTAGIRIRAGERLHFSARFVPPELLDNPDLVQESATYLDRCLDDSLRHWREWSDHLHEEYRDDPQLLRSALMLKALTFERTGAIAAAATTSLPEWIGGERNWDYRYSWIRDSVFAVRALHQLGFMREADRFACFIQRSAGGEAEQLQTLFGVDGHRRSIEVELPSLAGYRGSTPVRIGNAAATQLQLDAYGELLELAWLRYRYGRDIAADWDFLADIVGVAARRWREPDFGIWEVRTEPQHFVFSKALCWVALQRGIELARACGLPAPLDDWCRTRDAIRHEIETEGYDARHGRFRQAYGNGKADASLLLLPWFEFLPYDDPRMLRTVDHVIAELDKGGLVRRYDADDGLHGPEGVFVPCTFWLVDCLARQGRMDDAQRYYERASACANDLGIYSEEFDVDGNAMLGNFAQGLTHMAQIIARLALANEHWRDETRSGCSGTGPNLAQRRNKAVNHQG